MLNEDEQNIFEDARQHVADAITALVDDGAHPALIYATVLSEISSRITAKDFWGDKRPDRLDFQGNWRSARTPQEKAFIEPDVHDAEKS